HIDNWSRPNTTVSGIFDKYCDSYFGIFARGKSKEYSVIFAMWILYGSCLTTHFHTRNTYSVPRSTRNVHGAAHPFDNGFVVPGIYPRTDFFLVLIFYYSFFTNCLNKMWSIIKATIGNDSHDISHLQWRYTHLTLSDGQGNIKTGTPFIIAIALGVKVGSRY